MTPTRKEIEESLKDFETNFEDITNCKAVSIVTAVQLLRSYLSVESGMPDEMKVPEMDSDHAAWGNADDSFTHGWDIGHAEGYNQSIEKCTLIATKMMEEARPTCEEIMDSVGFNLLFTKRFDDLSGGEFKEMMNKIAQAIHSLMERKAGGK